MLLAEGGMVISADGTINLIMCCSAPTLYRVLLAAVVELIDVRDEGKEIVVCFAFFLARQFATHPTINHLHLASRSITDGNDSLLALSDIQTKPLNDVQSSYETLKRHTKLPQETLKRHTKLPRNP